MKRSLNFYLSAIALLLLLASCTKEYINIYENNTYISNQKEITKDTRPPYLSAGDQVAIVATSNFVTEEEMAAGKAILESWGLKVKEADNLYYQDGRYAGTVEERVEGLQRAIDNPNIKAIIAARGGYGCAQIVDKVNLSPLEKTPKWFVGYSDLTVMHAAINNRGIETIHGAMANNLANPVSSESLRQLLFGQYTTIAQETDVRSVEGLAEGRLVGGNLTIIHSVGGTSFDYNMVNAILFIEEVGEPNYAVDRMLMNLRLSGKLNDIKGIIVGQFTDMYVGRDKSIEEIITEATAGLNIPIMYGMESGHGSPNISLYLGRPIRLEVNSTHSTITYLD